MKKLLTISVLIVLIFTTISFASNPADLTANYRVFASEFYKIANDGKARFVMFNLPYSKNGNLCIFSLQDGEFRLVELIAAKTFFSWADIALISDISEGKISQTVAFDARWKKLGIGVMFPIDPKKDDVTFGPRLTIEKGTFFITTSLAKNPINFYGISYNSVKGFVPEAAYGDKTFFLKINRGIQTGFGLIIPELRTIFSKQKNTYGFGLGFIPKS